MDTKEVLTPALLEKYSCLKNIISQKDSVIVAYSGGVDSTLLAVVSFDILADKMIALTGLSPAASAYERDTAIAVAKQFGFPHVLIQTNEMDDINYSSNPSNRCYFCKNELFTKCLSYAEKHGFQNIFEGLNFDDQMDHRPGRKAAQEVGVISPLYEAELTKVDIRALAKELDIPNHDMPNSACLASRFPTGTVISVDGLKQVEDAETYLRSLGFKQIRVRFLDKGKLARVEVGTDEIEALKDKKTQKKIRDYYTNLGFLEVAFDEEGYRTGKLHLSPQ